MPLFGKSKPKSPPKKLEQKHLSGAPQLLGSDTANEVYKTSYKQGKGFGGNNDTGYFKEDTDMTVSKYAVGASSLAQGMGLGGLIPETKFGHHNITGSDGKKRKNVKGAVSAGANGDALGEDVWDTEMTQSVQAMRDAGLGEQEINDTFSNMYKKKGDRWFANSGVEVNEIDLKNPDTQKGLNQLQWFDSLIGNVDRHKCNILVDDNGKVSGIDNDLAFGAGQQAKNDTGGANENFAKGQDEKYLGLPEMIDQDTANKLLALDQKQIKKLLNPKGSKKKDKFNKDELQQTYDRLAEIQAKVQQMQQDGKIVQQWDDTTYQSQVNEDLTGRKTQFNKNPVAGSYLQRHHKDMAGAKDTNNPSLWRKGQRQQDTTPAPPQPVQQVQQPQPVQQPVQQPAPTKPVSSKPPSYPPPLPPRRSPKIEPPVDVKQMGGPDAKPVLKRRPTPKVLQNSPWKGM
jgi:hypothetical protein